MATFYVTPQGMVYEDADWAGKNSKKVEALNRSHAVRVAFGAEGKRYVVTPGSFSGHCCFEASVVDTGSEKEPVLVAECFEVADAEKIAEALNREV